MIELGTFVAEREPIWHNVLGRDIELEVTWHDGAGRVVVDPIDFEQVLLNLVLNARDAMDGSGRLRIDVSGAHGNGATQLPPGEYAAISVTDDGPGIAPEHIEGPETDGGPSVTPTGGVVIVDDTEAVRSTPQRRDHLFAE